MPGFPLTVVREPVIVFEFLATDVTVITQTADTWGLPAGCTSYLLLGTEKPAGPWPGRRLATRDLDPLAGVPQADPSATGSLFRSIGRGVIGDEGVEPSQRSQELAEQGAPPAFRGL